MSTDIPISQRGDPTWEIASLFPPQGYWSVEEYLHLDSGRLVEFVDGLIEVLTMPTELHQLIAAYLFRQLSDFAENADIGLVLFAPLKMQVRSGKFREPDVLFMFKDHRQRRNQRFWLGADLVMEVVSEDDPQRDLVVKREEYAQAAIPEYWIVDPRDRSIVVLVLDDVTSVYQEEGRYLAGQLANSVLLPGFSVDVRDTFERPEAAL